MHIIPRLILSQIYAVKGHIEYVYAISLKSNIKSQNGSYSCNRINRILNHDLKYVSKSNFREP